MLMVHYNCKITLMQAKVNGVIGITVVASMYVPLTNGEDDKEAANRALAFFVAW